MSWERVVRFLAVSGLLIEALGCGPKESGNQAQPGGCKFVGTGEVADRDLAFCLAESAAAPASTAGQAERPVVLFVDRSKSMRGFLDPAYPTRIATDYRSVIDRLVVGLKPESGYSFGVQIRAVSPTLGTLGSPEFYLDTDTRMEQAFDIIATDSATDRTYIIVGDGRRGTPQVADAQFAKMRSLAERWVDGGGAFMVGASLAPFKTVPDDPSGCRTDRPDDPRQTCPLFAFAFVAKGADTQISATLSQVFEHLFAWPIRPIEGGEIGLFAAEVRSDVRFERKWQTSTHGEPIVRSRGPSPVQQWLSVAVRLNDTVDAYARGRQAQLDGQGITLRLHSRRFSPEAFTSLWQKVERAGLIRISPEQPLTFDLITRGETAPATIFRAELVPNGLPSWLDAMDATNADDRIRTYGFGRLFETFRQRAAFLAMADSAAIARFYLVAN